MSNLPIQLDWDSIDTVLLDMDGTLLDLHFDFYFYLLKEMLVFSNHSVFQLDIDIHDIHEMYSLSIRVVLFLGNCKELSCFYVS